MVARVVTSTFAPCRSPASGSRGTESAAVVAPYDGAEIGRVPVCTAADVDRAVAVAKDALAAGLPTWKRAEILDTAARLLAERRDDFARTIAVEAAKPLKTARVEAERAVETFRFAAAEARTLAGDVVPLDATASGVGKIGFTLRVPIGVVGAISPFNFPLNLVAHKLAPAIAAGCPVVLKPASQTPFSAIALAELLIDDCGLPAEWLHVVTGGGSTVGNALVDHDDIALITFTGSPEVGWSIRGRAPRKKVGLELGNNAPVIIEPDSDWHTAATKIRTAGFSHAGQSCISTQRVLVHRDIADAFTETLVKEVSSLVVGDPLDEATDVSALISTGERDRVKAWVDEAVAEGATVAHGGERRRARRARADRADRRHAGHEGVLAGGVRAGRRGHRLRRPRRGAAPGQRLPLRAAGGDLHPRHRRRPAGDPHARLRRRAGQRGADVAGRPAALRRRARQRQHARGPGVLGARDDRAAHGRARRMSLRWGVLGARSQIHRARLRPAFGLAGPAHRQRGVAQGRGPVGLRRGARRPRRRRRLHRPAERDARGVGAEGADRRQARAVREAVDDVGGRHDRPLRDGARRGPAPLRGLHVAAPPALAAAA